MPEFSSGIYAEFRRSVRRRLRWTLCEATRVQRVRALVETLEPSERSAIAQAAQWDESKLGKLICRSFLLDVQEISEALWPSGPW